MNDQPTDIQITLPCDNYTTYSGVQSCCKNYTDHLEHMRHKAILQYMEKSGYIVIPPVSTGYGSARMTKAPALKYLTDLLTPKTTNHKTTACGIIYEHPPHAMGDDGSCDGRLY